MSSADLPVVNALLNGTAAVLLIAGRLAIRKSFVERHRRLMLTSLGVSSLFLACYLVYHALHGTTRFTTEGLPRIVYFTILVSHTLLAVANLPLIGGALFFALKGQYDRHRRWARLAWPVWVYISVTGVAIYVMLYQLWPQRG